MPAIFTAMKFLIVFLFSAATCVEHFQEWNSFKTKYGKKYGSEAEDLKRMRIFLNKRKMIEEHNENYRKGLETYHMKMNRFGDMTEDELRGNFFNSYEGNEAYNNSNVFIKSIRLEELPDSVDWREHGAVSPVIDQGNCMACWAFSAIGSLEGQYFMKTGYLVRLSVQNLVDCSSNYGNEGCNGGNAIYAYNYITDNGGVDDEKSYPYEGNDGLCRFKSAHVAAEDSGYTDIPRGDEHALQEAVANVGPIAVIVDASQPSFSLYGGGIYYSKDCIPSSNHAMLVVGYGIENGREYWLVKNSWGTTWGEGGYIKMSKNKNNNCGIASLGIYPTVE